MLSLDEIIMVVSSEAPTGSNRVVDFQYQVERNPGKINNPKQNR